MVESVNRVKNELISQGHKALAVFPAVSTAEVHHNLRSEAEYFGTPHRDDYESVSREPHINNYDAVDGNYLATY